MGDYQHGYHNRPGMKDLLAGIFSCLLILATSVNGQDLAGIPENNLPQAKIQVSHEAVSPSWQLVWNEAREMVKKNELDGAIALYRKLIKDRQGLIEARFELALVLMRSDKENQAILELEHVVEARPHDIQALFILAELLSRSGQCDKAITIYKSLVTELDLQGKNHGIAGNGLLNTTEELSLAEVLEGIARCLESQERFNESITYLQKALSIEPDRKGLELDLACRLLRLKRAKSSLSHFQKLLPQYKDDPGFLTNYAKALLAAGDRDKAIRTLERFVALCKDNTGKDYTDNLTWGVNELVSLYLMNGEVRSAINVLENLKHDHPTMLDKQILATLGRLYFASRNYLKALEAFRVFLREKPDDKMGLLFTARTYERLQFLAPAISIYEKLLLHEPDPDIATHLGKLLLETESFDRANSLIAGDIYNGDDIKGREFLLRIYLMNGDRESVEKLLSSEGVFLKDNDISALYVSLVTSIGCTTGARMKSHLLGNALFALADQVEERRDLVQAGVKLLLDIGQQDLAERVLRRCWLKGRSLWSVDMLINNYLEKNMREEAVALLERALSVYSSSARLKLRQACLLLDMGETDRASKLLSSINTGDNWKWMKEKRLLYEGRAFGLAGRYEEALDIYGEIIQQAPNHLEAHRGRWTNFAAYGLARKADAEALGLKMITGNPPFLHNNGEGNGNNEKPVPILVKNGRMMPAPGACLKGLMQSEELLPPEDILSSPFCEMEGEACPLLLALAYERFENFSEAVAMWLSFLKRHDTYWPGYERLAKIYEGRDKAKYAEKLRYRACDKIKHLRLYHSESKTASEEVGPSDLRIWRELDDMVLKSWEGVFCSD